MKTIRIGKSWHFWVYDLGYQLLHGVDRAPLRVSLCLYCLHAAIGIFLAPIALFFAGLIVLFDFAYIGFNLVIGKRPVGWSIKRPFDEKFIAYDLRIGKLSLHPAHLLVFFAVIGMSWYFFTRSPVLVGMLAGVVLFFCFVWFVVKEGKLKFLVPLWTRLGVWFRAEKEKVCPMIEIVETRSEAELEGGD